MLEADSLAAVRGRTQLFANVGFRVDAHQALFVTGPNASVFHFDGQSWTSTATDGGGSNAIWGTSANDLWIAGAGGSVLRRTTAAP